MSLYDSSPEIEEFMARTRKRRSIQAVETKLEKAERRQFKNVLVPLDTLRILLREPDRER